MYYPLLELHTSHFCSSTFYYSKFGHYSTSLLLWERHTQLNSQNLIKGCSGKHLLLQSYKELHTPTTHQRGGIGLCHGCRDTVLKVGGGVTKQKLIHEYEIFLATSSQAALGYISKVGISPTPSISSISPPAGS